MVPGASGGPVSFGIPRLLLGERFPALTIAPTTVPEPISVPVGETVNAVLVEPTRPVTSMFPPRPESNAPPIIVMPAYVFVPGVQNTPEPVIKRGNPPPPGESCISGVVTAPDETLISYLEDIDSVDKHTNIDSPYMSTLYLDFE